MYNLSNEGVRELSRSGLFRKEKVVREPLDGIPDGSNLVFRTSFKPIDSSEDVTVYSAVSGGSISSGCYTVDYDTGTVIFTSNAAPTSQPAIDYHWINITNREMKQVLIDGFDTMEAIWPRGWQLSAGSTTYSPADEDSTDIFVVSGENVNDPSCGDTVFSKSRVNRALYQCCCRLAYLNARLITAAEDDIDYREDRGITVTRSKRTPNLERAFNAEMKKMLRYLWQAWQKYYDEDDLYGRYYSSPATEDYLASYEWQYYSKLQDLRTTYKYRGT